MNYKDFAISLAKQAGQIIKENFTLGMAKDWKSDNSPVTETDLRINKLLLDGVKASFPGHRVKAEEESNMEGDSEFVWVCDPVDGTIPFSHGIPICTFSLALTKNGESILGVVYDPFQDRLFTAVKGEGAFLNGKAIHVSKIDHFKSSAGNFEMYETAYFNFSKLANHLIFKEGVKLMKLSSFVYPSALVAAGELAFCLFPGLTSHDGAAIKVIVEEAGGKVTSIFGDEQRYDQDIQGLIVSNGILHDHLVKLAKEMVTKT